MRIFNTINNYIGENSFRIIFYLDKIDIINYESIKEISSNRIIIRSEKDIIIEGKSLCINKLLDKELLIKGKIERILFNE